MMDILEKKAAILIAVLMVAPSSLSAPMPAADPHQVLVLGGPYCAGCSPINPQQQPQFVLVPVNAINAEGGVAIPTTKGIQGSGVLPPEQRLNSLGDGPQEPGMKIWDDGSIPVQKMAMHDDGRYSFSYDTAHSSRQEQRNLDGSVEGSYSYTDPTGKLVQIGYTAGPNKGYTAYGENVPPQPAFQLPQPVHDTPEVQEARQRHLEAYAEVVARIEKERAERAEAEKVADSEGEADSTGASSSDDHHQSGDDAAVISDEPEPAPVEGEGDALVLTGKSETVSEDAPEEHQQGSENQGRIDEQTDAIVVSADDEPLTERRETGQDEPKPATSSLPSPSYQITIPIGVGPNAGLSIQSGPIAPPPVNTIHNGLIGIPQPVIDTPEVQRARQEFLDAYNKELERIQKAHQEALEKAKNAPVQEPADGNEIKNENSNNNNAGDAKSNLQPYFYYVSVGGTPHYITSAPQPGQSSPSPYPTSLKATLLGAVPLAAVHDAQVPNRGKTDEQISGQTISGAAIRPVFLDLENTNSVQEGQNKNENANVGQTSQQQNVNPILGQLVPLGLAPVNTGSGGVQIGYIILNPADGSQSNGNAGQQQQQQQQQIPLSFLNVPQIQLQQQQQPQQSSSTSSSSSSAVPVPAISQPVILFAKKK